MDSLISPTIEVAFSIMACTKRHLNYLRKLDENLDQLKNKMAELIACQSDISARVNADVKLLMRRTNKVNLWMTRVENMKPEVDQIILEGEQQLQKRCLHGCCPENFWKSYKVGKRVVKKLLLVQELLGSGNFETVSDNPPCPDTVEEPLDPTVGLVSMFDSVRGVILRENSVRIMGLYGKGGVGKTTLLKKINNEIRKTSCDFDKVIFLVISQNVVMARVQEEIAKRLGLPSDSDKNKIFNVLKTMKYLLLLDDLWDRIELSSIGVPPPSENHSKVVFTTRSKYVCGLMEADTNFEVKCLNWEDSWNLFQQKVGSLALNSHPEIPDLAKTVAEECQGLPLALITIGRAMARKMTPQEWDSGISVLQNSASEIQGMEDKLFERLKFSYDSLPDDDVKKCFLFCSLYPEDYIINIVKLIEQWMGEGYISGYDNFEEAFNKGHMIVGTLKNACLLEEANNDVDPFNLYDDTRGKAVKMHDVLRDLALWIARDCGREKDKYFVKAGWRLTEAPDAANWPTMVEKISLMKNDIVTLDDIPKCPNIKTLLLSKNPNLETISDNFFLSMPALRLLDLSSCYGIKNLPTSFGQLHELEYLDLSYMGLKTSPLPYEFRNLKKLKYLSLINTSVNLCGIFMNLPNLEILKLSNAIQLDIDELGCLTKLKLLEIVISSGGMRDVEKFLSFPQFAKCKMIFGIYNCHRAYTSFTLSTSSSSSSDLCLGNLKNLWDLKIGYCSQVMVLKLNHINQETEDPQRHDRPLSKGKNPANRTGGLYQNLERLLLEALPRLTISWDVKDLISSNVCFSKLHIVSLSGCNTIEDLTWLLLIPNIQKLLVKDCKWVQELISSSDESGRTYPCDKKTFLKLQYLELVRLPNFQSICSMSALSFSSLEIIKVWDCPKLRRLPLDANSAKNTLKKIHGQRNWWNGLEWENDIIKTQFESLLKEGREDFWDGRADFWDEFKSQFESLLEDEGVEFTAVCN